MHRLRIALVGGGIGGLFAANALAGRGIEASVYEQAPELGEIGAGVLLTPNSVRQLERVGAGKAVAMLGPGSAPTRATTDRTEPVSRRS